MLSMGVLCYKETPHQDHKDEQEEAVDQKQVGEQVTSLEDRVPEIVLKVTHWRGAISVEKAEENELVLVNKLPRAFCEGDLGQTHHVGVLQGGDIDQEEVNSGDLGVRKDHDVDQNRGNQQDFQNQSHQFDDIQFLLCLFIIRIDPKLFVFKPHHPLLCLVSDRILVLEVDLDVFPLVEVAVLIHVVYVDMHPHHLVSYRQQTVVKAVKHIVTPSCHFDQYVLFEVLHQVGRVGHWGAERNAEFVPFGAYSGHQPLEGLWPVVYVNSETVDFVIVV
jgi:hypothetical protein